MQKTYIKLIKTYIFIKIWQVTLLTIYHIVKRDNIYTKSHAKLFWDAQHDWIKGLVWSSEKKVAKS